MGKIGFGWGAVVEAASILQMTATYTQSKNIPEEQYMGFKEIAKTVIDDESLPSGLRAVAEALYAICPHGEADSSKCEACAEEAFKYV
jgi:hypothetical protein